MLRLIRPLTTVLVKVGLFVCLVGYVMTGTNVPSAKAAQIPAMTFTGAVNVLGLAMTVSPPEVAVPAGGRVNFVNQTNVGLTLHVGSQTTSFSHGQVRTFQFPGTDQPQQIQVKAVAIDIAVVGPLTASTGLVRVAPIQPDSATSTRSGQGQPATPGDSADSADSPMNSSADNPDISPPVLAADDPLMAPGEVGNAPQPRLVSDAEAINALTDPGLPLGSANKARSEYPQPLGPNPQTGLLIALATILLIGVGAVAIRAAAARRLYRAC